MLDLFISNDDNIMHAFERIDNIYVVESNFWQNNDILYY